MTRRLRMGSSGGGPVQKNILRGRVRILSAQHRCRGERGRLLSVASWGMSFARTISIMILSASCMASIVPKATAFVRPFSLHLPSVARSALSRPPKDFKAPRGPAVLRRRFHTIHLQAAVAAAAARADPLATPEDWVRKSVPGDGSWYAPLAPGVRACEEGVWHCKRVEQHSDSPAASAHVPLNTLVYTQPLPRCSRRSRRRLLSGGSPCCCSASGRQARGVRIQRSDARAMDRVGVGPVP